MLGHLRDVIVVEVTKLFRPEAGALIEKAVCLRHLNHFPQELSVFLLSDKISNQIRDRGVNHHIRSHPTILDGLDDAFPPLQIFL